jgi:hypothetical protein
MLDLGLAVLLYVCILYALVVVGLVLASKDPSSISGDITSD